MKNDQYFPHDATAGNNIKLMMLIEAEGTRGYGVYWLLLEFLRQQTDYKGRLSMLDMLARRVKTTRAVLLRIINNYALFVVEGERFYSPGLDARMRPLESKRAAKSEQCRRAAGSKWLKTSETVDAGALQEEESKGEERNNEEEGGKSSVKAPPEYANNKQTHNLEGLMQSLKALGIKDPKEVNAILALSDYGRLGHTVWGLLYHTKWGKIQQPGRFLIAAIRRGSGET